MVNDSEGIVCGGRFPLTMQSLQVASDGQPGDVQPLAPQRGAMWMLETA